MQVCPLCPTDQFSLLQALTCWCKVSDGMSNPPSCRFSRRQREKTTASVASERQRTTRVLQVMALLLPSTRLYSHRACSPRNLLQEGCSRHTIGETIDPGVDTTDKILVSDGGDRVVIAKCSDSLKRFRHGFKTVYPTDLERWDSWLQLVEMVKLINLPHRW